MREELRQKLRQAGLRLTSPRRAVLEVLDRPGTHLDAESIVRTARASHPSLSRQAVYDNLNALVNAHVLRRIEPAGSPSLYETRVGDNHHHLLCRVCRTTVDVDCVVGHAPCLQPSQDHGYVVDEAEVLFWGICPRCQSQSKT